MNSTSGDRNATNQISFTELRNKGDGPSAADIWRTHVAPRDLRPRSQRPGFAVARGKKKRHARSCALRVAMRMFRSISEPPHTRSPSPPTLRTHTHTLLSPVCPAHALSHTLALSVTQSKAPFHRPPKGAGSGSGRRPFCARQERH